MAHDKKESIEEFLDAVAAKQPTPGGGAVAALAGALAAAIGEMVLNYSVGKKELEANQDEITSALRELLRARQIMLELLVEDQAAFEQLTAMRKIPHDQSDRAQKFDAAAAACIQIPQTVAATAIAILHLCEALADGVNKYLLSDLAVCAELAMATLRCAVYNVRVNLPDLSDVSMREKLAREMEAQVAAAVKTLQRTLFVIWSQVQADAK